MLPNLTLEVSFWQKAFGLDDWTITARHVEDPRYQCENAGQGYPAKGAPMAGLCTADRETKSARIEVRTPRTFRQLQRWPEIVCHEVMHVLGAAYRGRGWSIEKEHRLINVLAPVLVKLKRKNPKHAASFAATFAEAMRRAVPPEPRSAEPDIAAAMGIPPRERGT